MATKKTNRKKPTRRTAAAKKASARKRPPKTTTTAGRRAAKKPAKKTTGKVDRTPITAIGVGKGKAVDAKSLTFRSRSRSSVYDEMYAGIAKLKKDGDAYLLDVPRASIRP